MFLDKLKEECGVFGVSLSSDDAVGVTYNGLLALQHRGQEGAGIAVVYDNRIAIRKDVGLVGEALSHKLAGMPRGRVAVGHNRYSTTGGNVKENVGPFLKEYLTGRIALSHNGNVTNASEVKEQLKSYGITFRATTDSEVIASLVAYFVSREQEKLVITKGRTGNFKDVMHSRYKGGDELQLKAIVGGIAKACKLLEGAFCLVIATGCGKMIIVRDPQGFRPLIIGRNESGIAVASESCALDSTGFKPERDVLPGEIVVVESGQIVYEKIKLKAEGSSKRFGLCIFEYVYFSRGDSIVDNQSVHRARVSMGKTLARENIELDAKVKPDIVCGVPDSGLDAAYGYSLESGIPLVSGFVKNRYLGRSFIYPTQSQRESIVRLKLNPVSMNVKGKSVILVDDSIVRGTTSKKIVRALKDAGAKEVHLRISSPPFLYTCHFGTDIDNEENLIANKVGLTSDLARNIKSEENKKAIQKIRDSVGADTLAYISLEGLLYACRFSTRKFCTACFTGYGN